MPFHIRDAITSPSDTDAMFISSAFDSCIPHLASIGSATQWGTTPLSTSRPDLVTRHITAIADAEKYRLSGSGSPLRVLIAEALLPPSGSGEEESRVPVGAATLRAGYFPQYVCDQKHLQDITSRVLAGDEGPFMFLEILVTDFREATKAYRKGAGAALVEYAREWAARELGMGVMYVDCWAGNEEKLVRFYEAQGFKRVDRFVVEKPNGEKWPGMFLRMDIGKKCSV
ncbi:hypothetical protein N657DRAFT_642615 [Parathielavia appendiculata]|uniref:N-acetyltransferase domain-containing protein n=1 Tax=Parathielavia appendiculata TaxID=2587402 RepID=A0AAN6Z4Z1_9PEZI|nr:hypothetical protein N657DRAFT_642615 [Parathielavia appendiculata]